MTDSIVGTITSRNISVLGDLRYGFVGVLTDDNRELKVKIKANTKWNDLDVGERVRVTGKFYDKDQIFDAESVTRLN